MIPAGIGVIAVLLVGAFVLTRGGGSKDAGPCVTDLLAHLPSETRAHVVGSDLVAARSAGFSDAGSLEELGDTQMETGAIPDPLSQQLRFSRLMSAEDFKGRTGVELGSIRCSLASIDRAVFQGTFDVAEVDGSELGADHRLAATPDHLAYREQGPDPEPLLEPRSDGGLGSVDDVRRVVDRLRGEDAYGLVVEPGNREAQRRARAAGVGVAPGDGEGRSLVVAWAFPSDDAARAGRSAVAEQVNELFEGTVSIDAGDLELDGSMVWAKVPTREAPDLLAVIGRDLPLIEAPNGNEG